MAFPPAGGTLPRCVLLCTVYRLYRFQLFDPSCFGLFCLTAMSCSGPSFGFEPLWVSGVCGAGSSVSSESSSTPSLLSAAPMGRSTTVSSSLSLLSSSLSVSSSLSTSIGKSTGALSLPHMLTGCSYCCTACMSSLSLKLRMALH